MPSDTPLTDAEVFEAWDNPRGSASPAMDVVYSDFARRLERRVSALEAGLRELCEAYIKYESIKYVSVGDAVIEAKESLFNAELEARALLEKRDES